MYQVCTLHSQCKALDVSIDVVQFWCELWKEGFNHFHCLIKAIDEIHQVVGEYDLVGCPGNHQLNGRRTASVLQLMHTIKMCSQVRWRVSVLMQSVDYTGLFCKALLK